MWKNKSLDEIRNKKYNLIEVLTKVLIEYNLRTVYSTIDMTPEQALKKDTEGKLQEDLYREMLKSMIPYKSSIL